MEIEPNMISAAEIREALRPLYEDGSESPLYYALKRAIMAALTLEGLDHIENIRIHASMSLTKKETTLLRRIAFDRYIALWR